MRFGQAKLWAIGIVMTTSYWANKFDEVVMTLALPQIQQDIGTSEAIVQWLQTISFIAVAALSIPLSKLSDRFGLMQMSIFTHVILIGLRVAQFFVWKNFPVMLALRFLSGGM